MSNLKARGFIIREVPVGESDRIINILTADFGLITASARGSRRTRGGQLLSTQVYSLSHFELFHNKGKYSVNAAELIEPFLALHHDVDRLVCAAHLAEVMLDACRDDIPLPNLYRLWAFFMQAMQKSEDPFLVVHIAQVRLLAEIGYAPCIDSCASCGSHAVAMASPADRSGRPDFCFSVQACGLVCSRSECRRNVRDGQVISPGVLNCLKYCLEAPLARLFQCRVNLEVRRGFCSISGSYLVQQMEKYYSKLKMLDNLNEIKIDPAQ